MKFCFTRTDKIGSQWSFPEADEIQSTSVDQVLLKFDNVGYQCITRIRCFIDKQVTKQITKQLFEINEKFSSWQVDTYIAKLTLECY